MENQLRRMADGRLRFTTTDGQSFENVTPVRAFPISAPDQGVSLLSAEGRELLWIESLAEWPEPERELLQQALDQREFMPEIRRLISVSGFVTPCTWTVETDRGDTQFILKGEEDIRRLNAATLLISDSQGINYLLRDLSGLDRMSRKLLDRFL
jgi:hypothetical protein